MVVPETILECIELDNTEVKNALKTLHNAGFWESLANREKDFIVTNWREDDAEQIKELNRFAIRNELYGSLTEAGNILTEAPKGDD